MTVESLVERIVKLALEHPDTVAEIGKAVVAIGRSPGPVETARRAALAAAAHAAIEAL